MVILGLQFGHDAGVAVLVNGVPACNMTRERHNRAKHSFGISLSHIEAALSDANLSVDDVDMIAVTSTQCYELVVVDEPDQLKMVYGLHPDMNTGSFMYDHVKPDDAIFESHLDGNVLSAVYSEEDRGTYHRNLFPEYLLTKQEDLGVTKSLRDYLQLDFWGKELGLKDLAKTNISELLNSSGQMRNLFHYPMNITLKGVSIPGVTIQHHAAHAASAFYTSKSSRAAVFTHDGGFYKTGPLNGMIFYGKDNYLLPLSPNHLAIGDLYDRVGSWLGFDLFGSAGKLMGLAPYGKPVFFDRQMVGNTYDLLKNGIENPLDTLLQHYRTKATFMGYDVTAIGQIDRILDPVCVDIAASTQKLFEEVILYAVEAVSSMLQYSGIHCDTLCYTGGTGLNCPSNSRLVAESGFDHVHIPPNCDDSGLSLGAAQYAYYQILDKPRVPLNDSQFRITPYLGLSYGEETFTHAIEAVRDQIIVENLPDPAKQAAQDLHDNKIIAWFEGRSEIGPRALGHRSLLINPKYASNWDRMNELKSREKWRPFAPAVLAEDASTYFRGIPEESPFMLFTGQVRTNELPAITHVDGSARVQTVTEETGGLFRVLTHLKTLCGCSVVLNTSFNGPREPIVEKPKEAIQFLLSTKLDALYLEGKRITRI